MRIWGMRRSSMSRLWSVVRLWHIHDSVMRNMKLYKGLLHLKSSSHLRRVCFWEVTWLCRAPRRLPWESWLVCCLWRWAGWSWGLGRLWADWSCRLYRRRRDRPSWPALGGAALSSPRLAGGPRPWHSGPYRRDKWAGGHWWTNIIVELSGKYRFIGSTSSSKVI